MSEMTRQIPAVVAWALFVAAMIYAPWWVPMLPVVL